MLNVTIVCAGTKKVRESYFRDACAEYEKRLGAYCRLHITECGESDAEILAAVPRSSYLCALCINAPQLTSEELADKLDSLATRGVSSVTFVIGGSDGFGKSVEAAADMRLSFSRMTFPHRLMRVILLEQLYRAFNINAGGSYHK